MLSLLFRNEPLVNENLINGIFQGIFIDTATYFPFFLKWWIEWFKNSNSGSQRNMGYHVTYPFHAYLSLGRCRRVQHQD